MKNTINELKARGEVKDNKSEVKSVKNKIESASRLRFKS